MNIYAKTCIFMHKKKEQLNRKNILQLLFLQIYYFFDSVLCNLKVAFVKFNAYEVPTLRCIKDIVVFKCNDVYNNNANMYKNLRNYFYGELAKK